MVIPSMDHSAMPDHTPHPSNTATTANCDLAISPQRVDPRPARSGGSCAFFSPPCLVRSIGGPGIFTCLNAVVGHYSPTGSGGRGSVYNGFNDKARPQAQAARRKGQRAFKHRLNSATKTTDRVSRRAIRRDDIAVHRGCGQQSGKIGSEEKITTEGLTGRNKSLPCLYQKVGPSVEATRPLPPVRAGDSVSLTNNSSVANGQSLTVPSQCLFAFREAI